METLIATIIIIALVFYIIGVSAIFSHVSAGLGVLLFILPAILLIAIIYIWWVMPFKPMKKNDIVRNNLLAGLSIVLCVGLVWGMTIRIQNDNYNPAAAQQKINEQQLRDLGYYKKNGKWYYQGDGANGKTYSEQTLWEIMNQLADE